MSEINEGEWVIVLRPQRLLGRDITFADLRDMAQQFEEMPVQSSFGEAFGDPRCSRSIAWADGARVDEDGALRIRIVDKEDATERERADVRDHLSLAFDVERWRILCLAVSADWHDGAPIGNWGDSASSEKVSVEDLREQLAESEATCRSLRLELAQTIECEAEALRRARDAERALHDERNVKPMMDDPMRAGAS